MKKVLSFVLVASAVGILTGGYLVFDRFQKNPQQIVPYPYYFLGKALAIQLDAPILITGDRMGDYFSRFRSSLAESISVNLSEPIKIQSIAKNGQGLHRTLHDLRALKQWPQILIYQGGSEEYLEKKFELSEIPKIKENFQRFADDRIETFIILYPWLSRFLYEPVKMVPLKPDPESSEISQKEYLERLETEIILYEQQLLQLVSKSKDRNTLLILTTTPINLDIPPRSVCEFTSTTTIDAEILRLREHLKRNDLKTAFSVSSKLVIQHMGNAEIHHLRGVIAKRLGNIDEARNHMLEASAYDCSPWRATEVHNSIIRKIAKDQQVLLFDFAKMVEKDWMLNTTFFDEVYPQNLYYERAMKQLGEVIKNILKL